MAPNLEHLKSPDEAFSSSFSRCLPRPRELDGISAHSVSPAYPAKNAGNCPRYQRDAKPAKTTTVAAMMKANPVRIKRLLKGNLHEGGAVRVDCVDETLTFEMFHVV